MSVRQRMIVSTSSKIYTIEGKKVRIENKDTSGLLKVWHDDYDGFTVYDLIVPIHDFVSATTVTVPATDTNISQGTVVSIFDPSKISVEELMNNDHDASSTKYLSELSQWANSAWERCDAIKSNAATVRDKIKASSLSGDGEIIDAIDRIDGRVDAITADVAIIKKTGKLRKDMVLTSVMGVIDHEIDSLTSILKDIDGLVSDISSSDDADIAGKSMSVIERLKSILDLSA